MPKLRNAVALACAFAVAVVGSVSAPRTASASSHREAPYTSTDQQVDATDVYAFTSPDRSDSVTLIANYIPLQDPASGPYFFNFGDEVLYEINIDNNGDARDDISFQFDFRTTFRTRNTFLYNTGPITALNDPNLNLRQFYDLRVLTGARHNDPQRRGVTIARNLQVAPYNVGPASFPRGYKRVANQARYTIGGGGGQQADTAIRAFAGPRDDPFFIDVGGAFDLLQLDAIAGRRVTDDLVKKNVHTLAIQVPKALLRGNNGPVIGVRTTSYRRSMSVLRPGTFPGVGFQTVKRSSGPYVQVSRLENPLVNELVVPIRDKDRFNGSKPRNDTQFARYVLNPELAQLLELILKVDTPEAPRTDLATIFLTGIPGLNQPRNVRPSSQLRLNLNTPLTRNPNRLGLLGGDVQGYPNGRRLADDVTDISLRAVAGGTPFTPRFNKSPNNQLGDAVNRNDKPFDGTFPYVAAPHDHAGATR